MPETVLHLDKSEVTDSATIQALLREQEENARTPFIRWELDVSASAANNGINRAVFGEFDQETPLPCELEVFDYADVNASDAEASKLLNDNPTRRPILYSYALIGGVWRRMLVTRPAKKADFLRKIIDLAEAEWQRFGKQEYFVDGTKNEGKKETEPVMANWIDDEYWAKGAQVKDAGPWSAAFISYIMGQAGLSRALFPFSSAHRTYINAAVKLEKTGKGTIAYLGKEVADHEPQVGDLICGWYENDETQANGPVTYATAEAATRAYPSHCDIVVAKSGDEIMTIGGNVGNSVTKKHYKLENGRLTNDPYSKGFFAILANRFATLEPLASVLPAHPEAFNINTNLKLIKSPLTAEKIRAFFAAKPANRQALIDIGQPVMDAAARYGINATYIVAHAIWESDWGRSKYARDRFNLFGWGAIDSDPDKAWPFASFADCIDRVMGRINVLYLNPDGPHFRDAPVLGDAHHGMNVKYASDKQWGEGIAALARQIEAF